MFKGISHIGIAVKSLDEAMKNYVDGLGGKASPVHEMPDMKAIMVTLGSTTVELIEPVGTEGPIAKFLANRGEGIHHICFEVDDIVGELASLAGRGVRLVNSEPRQGIEGRTAFLHPKSANGVLVELVEK